MTDEQVVRRLRAAVKTAGGVRPFGEKFGISKSYLYDVLRGDRKPGPAIGAALRLTSVRVFQRGEK